MLYAKSDSLTNFTPLAKNGHMPVMLEEALSLLAPKNGETYLDCTFGGGGHSRAILESCECKLVAIDRDPEAEIRAKDLKKDFPDRFEFASAKFSELNKLHTRGYAGILFDFGVSSFQLDKAERGFSFMREGPLDMRMNPSEGESALEFIKNSDEFELGEVLRKYGEQPSFRKLAREIKRAASSGQIESTSDLAECISQILPKKFGEKTHPATRAFQAIRIAVNGEISEIENALPLAFDALKSGGVLVAISFHSLEDRIVKRFFKRMAGRPEDRFDRSVLQDRNKQAELLTKKPIEASDTEKALNPRSRSAKLRAIRKD